MGNDIKFTLTEETLPIIEQIANQMPGGFFIYKADGDEELLYFNSAMLSIFGCSSADEFRSLTRNSFRGIVHPDDLDAVEKSIVEQISANVSSSLDYVEYRIIRKDGTVRYVEDYGHFVHTADYGDLYYVFINDCTEKRMARELERIQNLNRIKMKFLFDISHDIRTPMNSIMGFTALAKSHINDPGLLAEYLEKVDISNHHMMSLIDDILEMSGIEGGHITLREEKCDLRQLMNRLTDLTAPAREKKHISMISDTDLPDEDVFTDVTRFSRIISNILSNAVKFTNDGGEIRIYTRKTDKLFAGKYIYEFRISDNGIGISKEFLPSVFEPFEREETATKTGYPGAGLGLSIAKSLLGIMDGTVSVTSEKGKGSEFTVNIPMRSAERDKITKLHSPARNDSDAPKRILIVEDIEINLMLTETVLHKYGFITEAAPDGSDAVKMFTEHPDGYYDLILMDIQMPVMNGYDATRAIRAIGSAYAAYVPIIALSANASADDRRMSFESGMNGHISKPFEISELISSINRFTE